MCCIAGCRSILWFLYLIHILNAAGLQLLFEITITLITFLVFVCRYICYAQCLHQLHATSVISVLAAVKVCIILSSRRNKFNNEHEWRKKGNVTENITDEMHFILCVASFPMNTSPYQSWRNYLLHLFMTTSRCCCNSACACIILGGLMACYWVRRLGMVDWVKWTVTTIWFAFTWSSCFPYFPFVCSPGCSPVWEEWCDAAENTQFSITSTIITVINSSNING